MISTESSSQSVTVDSMVDQSYGVELLSRGWWGGGGEGVRLKRGFVFGVFYGKNKKKRQKLKKMKKNVLEYDLVRRSIGLRVIGGILTYSPRFDDRKP